VAPASLAVTPAQFQDPVQAWTQQHALGLPIFQAEWGVVPFQDASIRSAFIRAVTSYLHTHPQIRAMLYWNAFGEDGHGGATHAIIGSTRMLRPWRRLLRWGTIRTFRLKQPDRSHASEVRCPPYMYRFFRACLFQPAHGMCNEA
jgi:hypothetical protein